MPKTVSNIRPMDILKNSLMKNVLIDVKGNREYSGVLEGYDVYMNVVLQNANEIINKESKGVYDRILVRGDNVIFVSPSKGDKNE
ncbi:MAG: LSM domain-containing protein [Thermoplasmata archaeon]